MYAILFLALGVLPQADREAHVMRKAQIRHEAILRNLYPESFQQPAPTNQVNVYAPTYNYGSPYGMPSYGLQYARPAWPPQPVVW
jgi:hypothetical protein